MVWESRRSMQYAVSRVMQCHFENCSEYERSARDWWTLRRGLVVARRLHRGRWQHIRNSHHPSFKLDPRTDEITLIGGPFQGRQKWYGGIRGYDGSIYGTPVRH